MNQLSLRALLVICATILLSPGCANQKLDPAGPYGGDFLLYQADGVIVDLDDVYDAVEGLAARNPVFFQTDEKAKSLLATIRKERDGVWSDDEIMARLFYAREVYKYTRDATSEKGLRGALQSGRALLDQARILIALFPESQ